MGRVTGGDGTAGISPYARVYGKDMDDPSPAVTRTRSPAFPVRLKTQRVARLVNASQIATVMDVAGLAVILESPQEKRRMITHASEYPSYLPRAEQHDCLRGPPRGSLSFTFRRPAREAT